MEGNHNQELVPQRRSSRIVMRVPLLINAADGSADTEWEQVQTVVVSQYGGLIRTQQKFSVGMMLDIRMRNKERSARGRVVWSSLRFTPQGADLGFEILDNPGFWEITFPPDRWPERMRRQSLSH